MLKGFFAGLTTRNGQTMIAAGTRSNNVKLFIGHSLQCLRRAVSVGYPDNRSTAIDPLMRNVRSGSTLAAINTDLTSRVDTMLKRSRTGSGNNSHEALTEIHTH